MEFDDMLFGLTGMLFDGMLLLCRCWMAFSLVPCALLVTITRDAPSKRSFKLSPTIRKFGKRIQHVFTVHEPLIPWHLHSCRISLWTCWNENKKYVNLLLREKKHTHCKQFYTSLFRILRILISKVRIETRPCKKLNHRFFLFNSFHCIDVMLYTEKNSIIICTIYMHNSDKYFQIICWLKTIRLFCVLLRIMILTFSHTSKSTKTKTYNVRIWSEKEWWWVH